MQAGHSRDQEYGTKYKRKNARCMGTGLVASNGSLITYRYNGLRRVVRSRDRMGTSRKDGDSLQINALYRTYADEERKGVSLHCEHVPPFALACT